ncbi:hypothetical protein [Salinimonas chungwhensis]|uniref:hypothetical protein n=1 Tax=Salinimonas chungwhensis TaxID=265425 RepID=UPI00037A17B0|nr:hypothetical protein [Salinimonas chungwhensis]
MMNTLYRIVVALACLAAAFTAYSFGHETGMFVFVVAGFALEGAFWLKLFPTKKKTQPLL